jgi:glutathione peroxidase-family protein
MEKSGDVFTSVPSSFWDLTADDIDGKEAKFDSWKGAKAFLIVNVASACGYTSNYSYLGQFYETYK